MTNVKFSPKAKEVLTQEVAKQFTDNGLDAKEYEAVVENIVALREKDEQFKTSLHDDKKKHLKAKEWYKLQMIKAGFDPKTGELIKKSNDEKPKGDDQEAKFRQIVAEENFINSGGTQTELRQIKKVMVATGKSFYDAQKDSLLIAFKEKQEREQKSRSSQLPPSRGGSFTPKVEEDAIAEKNKGNLPPGFTAETSKK